MGTRGREDTSDIGTGLAQQRLGAGVCRDTIACRDLIPSRWAWICHADYVDAESLIGNQVRLGNGAEPNKRYSIFRARIRVTSHVGRRLVARALRRLRLLRSPRIQ